jgi:hypothetical protein
MIILDVEASGLGQGSYPIEVAWQHRYDESRYDSFLIRPIPEWDYWDPYAEEKIHRISRDQLRTEGISIQDACRRLNDALAGQCVYTDCPSYDRMWIIRLFRTADVEKAFRVYDVRRLVKPQQERKLEHRLEMIEVKHRALSDVRGIIRCLNHFRPLDDSER